jgi:hypothetical protein
MIFGPKLSLGFRILRVQWNATYRTQLYALGLVEVPYALGAQAWIDFVKRFTHADGLIRAHGLTHITVDTLVSDHQCHENSPG